MQLAADPIGELDMFAVYIASHSHTLADADEHVLVTSDTIAWGRVDHGQPHVEVLRGTKVRWLLLMLDTCQSGRGGNEIAAVGSPRLTDSWDTSRVPGWW